MRTVRLLFTLFLALAFLLTMEGLVGPRFFAGVEIAQAQSAKRVKKKKRPSLLQILFGGKRKKKGRVKSRRRQIKKKQRKNRRRKAASPVAKIAVVKKLENAKKILVVGDFFASGLAKGLKRTFKQSPGVQIVAKNRGSSGFIRLDYYDWTAKIGALLEKTKPAVVIAMIGANDRQLMRQDGVKLQKRSEPWDAAYKHRVEAFTKAAMAQGTPLIWVGLPPVRFNNMNRDFLFFNQVYRSKTEKAGGQFIDIWDGFTNAEGNFVTSGPSVSGQIVRLRSKDGIKVTKSGQDKLAFYVEKAVKRSIGKGTGELIAGLPSTEPRAIMSQPGYDPAKTGRTVVIRLNDPGIDGGGVLAGAVPAKIPATKSAEKEGSTKVPEKEFIVGRADDYSWPPREFEPPLMKKEENMAGRTELSGRK